jgi:hypothetical protein
LAVEGTFSVALLKSLCNVFKNFYIKPSDTFNLPTCKQVIVGNADQHVLLDTPFMRLKTAVTTAW